MNACNRLAYQRIIETLFGKWHQPSAPRHRTNVLPKHIDDVPANLNRIFLWQRKSESMPAVHGICVHSIRLRTLISFSVCVCSVCFLMLLNAVVLARLCIVFFIMRPMMHKNSQPFFRSAGNLANGHRQSQPTYPQTRSNACNFSFVFYFFATFDEML